MFDVPPDPRGPVPKNLSLISPPTTEIVMLYHIMQYMHEIQTTCSQHVAISTMYSWRNQWLGFSPTQQDISIMTFHSDPGDPGKLSMPWGWGTMVKCISEVGFLIFGKSASRLSPCQLGSSPYLLSLSNW